MHFHQVVLGAPTAAACQYNRVFSLTLFKGRCEILRRMRVNVINLAS